MPSPPSRSSKTTTPQRSFQAWVIGIARNKVRQHFRNAGRDKLVFDDALLDAFSRHYTDTLPGYDDRVAALRSCMDKLPDDAQALLARRYYERQPVKSIARDLSQTPQRISKRLYTIRRALERCIGLKLRAEGGL